MYSLFQILTNTDHDQRAQPAPPAFLSNVDFPEEQGAAAKEPGTAKKPPGYLFFVPPGTVVVR